MKDTDAGAPRAFAGTAVQVVFAALLAVWLVLETGWLPESLYAPLVPVWLPSYLAFAVASGVRGTILPWLGSGALFGAVIVVLTYVEAVLLAGLFRLLRNGYRNYRRGPNDGGVSP